ncbi:hypothetical protein AABC73_02610 [Pseudomonas sp. G.S.17]|uniref:hypothetical protein n=1 Tax=Pseudomonas sp. G.S.17 TaxID=3137451 RepID=UPI00311CB436
MKNKNALKICGGVVALTMAGYAQAGPEVTITFKNNGTAAASYDVVGSSAYSYAEARPKPKAEINPGESDVYGVKGAQSPDVATVVFQYKMGAKICKFKTSYVKLPSRSGTVPKWNKSEQSLGGARCEARITGTNFATHDWTVEFSMK